MSKGFTRCLRPCIVAPMAILKIARMGHPVLAAKARPVADPTAPEIHRLANDMYETMLDAKGTGLAAPQVYVPLRVVLFFVEGERAVSEGDAESDTEAAEDLAVPLTLMINPQLEFLDSEIESGPEACLSVPGLMGQVPRYRRLRYRWQTLEGKWMARDATDFHARVVQHEYDHLDGILYPQRMADLSSLIFTSEIEAIAQAAERRAAEPEQGSEAFGPNR